MGETSTTRVRKAAAAAPMAFREAARRVQRRQPIDAPLRNRIRAETARATGGRGSGRFHVFLSHAAGDASLALGVWQLLQTNGIHAYLDWIVDPGLEREDVTRRTAQTLRKRMAACDRLIFVRSSRALRSRWMPWELGYFDGLKGRPRIAVLQLGRRPDIAFETQEYLQLYTRVSLAAVIKHAAGDGAERERMDRQRQDLLAFAKRAPEDLKLAVPGLEAYLQDTVAALLKKNAALHPQDLARETLGFTALFTDAVKRELDERASVEPGEED